MVQNKHWPILWLIAFILLPLPYAKGENQNGEIQTIQVKCDYLVGSNESLLSARRACFMEARRRALEKVGLYIQSYTKIHYRSDPNLAVPIFEEKIEAYTAGLIKADIKKEDIRVINGQIIIAMTVAAQIKLDDLCQGFNDYVRHLNKRGVNQKSPQIITNATQKTKEIFKKTFSDKDRDKNGNIKAFTWDKWIQPGDIIEVIGSAPPDSASTKDIYIYRGKKHSPRWKKAKDGYHRGKVKHVPIGKSYYLWIEPGRNIAVTVRISRQLYS